MTPAAALRALLDIWDELPSLVGPDWPEIVPNLQALVERLNVSQDLDVTTDLMLALRPYPMARTRLEAAAAAISASDDQPTSWNSAITAPSRRRTRSIGVDAEGGHRELRGGLGDRDGAPDDASRADVTGQLGSIITEPRQGSEAESATAGAPPTATCHVLAAMDDTLTVDQVTTIEVTVSRETIVGAVGVAADEGTAGVAPDKRLIIQLLPKANLEAVGESRVEIDVPATGDPTHVYFDVRPTDAGEARAWVVVRQGQIPLITLRLTAIISDAVSAGHTAKRTSAEGQAADVAQLGEPLQQLRISQLERGGTHYYAYELEAPALDLLDTYESRPITGDIEGYVSSLYKRIEDRWLSTNGDVAEFAQELREFGGELLDELIPEPLQELLWVNRRRLASIQVLATEPFIPWELVHLRQPGKPLPKETRFLGQMGLVRWLYGSGWPPDHLRVRPNRARYVIPDYPDERYALPETKLEREFLEQTFGATAVDPQPTAVRTLISTKGSFDLLHFAGHGAADSSAISEARLLLQGRIEDGQYIEASLTATTVDSRADLTGSDGARPVVVLNACQAGRLGYRLTGIGGFAEAFLKGGAGAFIGTQWSVGDAPARVFTETFYRRLLEGDTVAQATVAGRERARADGDATWLAYAVYAHPYARLTS
jgi:hypothetical protein